MCHTKCTQLILAPTPPPPLSITPCRLGQAGFFDAYGPLLPSLALWTSYGNHDAMRSSSETAQGTGPYFAAFSLPSAGEVGGVPSHTQAYYRC